MSTVFRSMATRSSHIDDLNPTVKIQIEVYNLTPMSDQNGLEDPGAFGSAPSHSPCQSLARKPTPDQHETWFCLKIEYIYTEDDKVIPPSPHT